MTTPASPRITIEDLTVAYGRRPAVHHLSGNFDTGSLTAIIGPNGAGKSSLLKSIIGLLRPSEGRIVFNGIGPRDIAYLPQQAEIDRSFPISVADTVALGFWRRCGWWKATGAAERRRVETALAEVGLEGFDATPVSDLSVGQFQRVLFARLLVQDAPVILLDEPFAALDERTASDLLSIIKRWHGESRTVIAVLHDLEQVRAAFPTALLLAREKIAWGPTAEILRDETLEHAQKLARSWSEDMHEHTRGRAA